MASVYSTSRLRYHSHSAEGSRSRRYDTPLDYFDMEAFDREWERQKSESHALPIDAYEPRERVLWYGYVPTSTGMDIPINSDGGRERYVQTLRDQVGVDPAKTNSLPLPRMDEGDDDDDDVAMLDLRNGSALTSLPRIPPNACDSPAESQLGDEFGDDTLLLRNGEVEEDDDLYMTPPPEERAIAPLPRRLLPPSSFPPTARIVLPTSRASSPASSVDVPLAQSSCASPTSHDVKSPEPPAPKLAGRKRKAQTVASSMPPPKRRGRPPRSRASATRDVSAASTAAPPPPLTTTPTTPLPTPALTMPAPTPALSTPAPTSPTPAPTPALSTPAPTSPTPALAPEQSTSAPTSPTPAPTPASSIIVPTLPTTPAPSIFVPTLPTTPAPSTPVPTSPTPTPTPAPSTPVPTSPTPTPAPSNPPPASPTPPPLPSTSSLSETSFLDITNAAGELLSQTEIEELITVIVSGVHPNAQGRYACPLGDCPQVCKSRGDLRRHLRTKLHMPASYKCDRCGGVYTREDALKRHARGCTARHR